jgi:hypothetical protein
MKVCASIHYGPWNHGVERFDTVAAAVEYFRRNVAGEDFGTGDSDQCMDIHPQCGLCTDGATFHDYPLARYVVGPRGGVRREFI